MIAARILGYGAEYKFNYKGKEETVDLSQIENKPLDESLYTKGLNEFTLHSLPQVMKLHLKF
jgi:hypothetical protein